jgi:hypothetical protein
MGSFKLPIFKKLGAGEESRTLDLNLGKVALYQLSYSRMCLDALPRWVLGAGCFWKGTQYNVAVASSPAV